MRKVYEAEPWTDEQRLEFGKSLLSGPLWNTGNETFPCRRCGVEAKDGGWNWYFENPGAAYSGLISLYYCRKCLEGVLEREDYERNGIEYLTLWQELLSAWRWLRRCLKGGEQ